MTDGSRLLQAKNGFKKIGYPKYAVGEFDTCFFSEETGIETALPIGSLVRYVYMMSLTTDHKYTSSIKSTAFSVPTVL